RPGLADLHPLKKRRQPLELDHHVDDADELRIDLQWRRGADAGAQAAGNLRIVVPARPLLHRSPIPSLLRWIVVARLRGLFADILNVVALGLEAEGVLAALILLRVPGHPHQVEVIAVALRCQIALRAEEAAVAGAERDPGQARSRPQQGQEKK